MKKLIIGAALASALLGGAAIAAQTTDTTAPQGRNPAARMAHMGDTNGDGAVSRDEYLAKAAARFAAMDTNKDGKVTPDEFKAARQARWAGHMGHGRGGPGGPGMMHHQGGPDGKAGPGGHGGGMLARLDANGDGKITRAEFNAPGDKRFDALDTNKDGVIDQAEQTAAREKMHARFQEMRAKWQANHAGGTTPPAATPQTPGE